MGVRWPPNGNHLFYNANYLMEELYAAMQIGGVKSQTHIHPNSKSIENV